MSTSTTTGKKLKSLSSGEKKILIALKKFKRVKTSKLAAELYKGKRKPKSPGRVVSVMLHRMEDKGLKFNKRYEGKQFVVSLK